jgi:hypothetical protein
LVSARAQIAAMQGHGADTGRIVREIWLSEAENRQRRGGGG